MNDLQINKALINKGQMATPPNLDVPCQPVPIALPLVLSPSMNAVHSRYTNEADPLHLEINSILSSLPVPDFDTVDESLKSRMHFADSLLAHRGTPSFEKITQSARPHLLSQSPQTSSQQQHSEHMGQKDPLSPTASALDIRILEDTASILNPKPDEPLKSASSPVQFVSPVFPERQSRLSAISEEDEFLETTDQSEDGVETCDNHSEITLLASKVDLMNLKELDINDYKPAPRMTVKKLREIIRGPVLPVGFPYSVDPIDPLLLEKFQSLQKRFLDEDVQKRNFLYRLGAFGYSEVFNFTFGILSSYQNNIQSESLEERMLNGTAELYDEPPCRMKKLPLEMRHLFSDILQPLSNELYQANQIYGPQIGIFREILLDFAQLQLETEPGNPMDPVKVGDLTKRLVKLEMELRRTVHAVQEKQMDFQPFAILCRKIELGQYKGLVLTDLGGETKVRISSDAEPSPAMAKEYMLLARLYQSYADDILDPHFLYCSKFLTAILGFKEMLSGKITCVTGLEVAPDSPTQKRKMSGTSLPGGLTKV